MLVSYEWLQSYFDDTLPEPERLAETLTFHAFEIEEVKQVGDDTVIDIDVLPNRSSDCLSHRGIAREISTLLDLELKDDPLKRTVTNSPDSNLLDADIQAKDLVNRFSAAVVSGIEMGESPKWLKKRLEAIGQKPINNIVDATNYVMFDLGQPLHAFDRDKLTEKDGGYVIAVRAAKGGEKVTDLTGTEHELDERNLLIVDGGADAPIGIAGVKGGKTSEVDENTTNLVLEAANFNYISVRKTSQTLKLWTDASVRFQNEPSPELTLHALREVVALIGGELEGFVDYYPKRQGRKSVSVTVPGINSLLGTSISGSEVEDILKRFDFEFEKDGESFTVTPPFERTDINIKEDLIEEVGRVYGYGKVISEALPEITEQPVVNKHFYYAEKIRQLLVEQGFSEVYTYSLQGEGEVELANALAADKPFMRSSLYHGLLESLGLNAHNAELLGLDQVRIFEIGTVFEKDGEYSSLGIGVRNAKKSKEKEPDVLEKVQEQLSEALGVEIKGEEKEVILEINFTELLEKLPEPKSYEEIRSIYRTNQSVKYKPFSQYPFVLRDIALWCPSGTTSEEVLDEIKKHAGELLVNSRQFDEFEKDGRVSYAFHLVFQSKEKTLSDEEVNPVMESVSSAVADAGWEVR